MAAYSLDLRQRVVRACDSGMRAARPRTFEQVVDLVAIALERFEPQECLNLVRHCGYRVYTAI